MKLVSSLALAAATAAAGLTAPQALAQGKAPAAPAQPAQPQRKYNISKEAQKPLAAVQAALKAKDEAAYAQQLAAAQAAVKTNDDKYILAQFMLDHAIQAKDTAAQLSALEASLASGGATPEEALRINRNIAILASQASNWARAETAGEAVLAATPNDIDMIIDVARAKLELKKTADALPLLQRAIQLTEASGKSAPEAWYRNALSIAYQTHNDAAVAQINVALLKAYPNKDNFKNALAIYRSSGRMPPNSELDVLRLIRASGTGVRNDYVALASVADQSALPGEVKSVVDEGRRLGVLNGSDAAQIYNVNAGKIAADRAALGGDEAKARAGGSGRLAMNVGNAYYGYGDYAKAAEIYRIATQKSDVDPSIARLRLGEALALAGQRTEAEAALRSVAGPYGGLAAMWLTWLTIGR